MGPSAKAWSWEFIQRTEPQQGTGQGADTLGCPLSSSRCCEGNDLCLHWPGDHGTLLHHTGRADGTPGGSDDVSQGQCGDIWRCGPGSR